MPFSTLRVVAQALGQGTTSDWITLQANPTNGQFNGIMTVHDLRMPYANVRHLMNLYH